MSDLIDRQKAIETLKEYEVVESDNFTRTDPVTMMAVATIANCIEAIVKLPSAESERKSGEWLEKEVFDTVDYEIPEWQTEKCSVCGKYHTTPYLYNFSTYKYCPNCGAEMARSKDEKA